MGFKNSESDAVPPGSAGGSSVGGGAVCFPHTPSAFPDEFDPALVPPELKKEVRICKESMCLIDDLVSRGPIGL